VRASVKLEACGALRDYAEMARDYGTPVTVIVRAEGDVARDSYGAIKRRPGGSPVQTYALPVERAVDSRSMQRTGIREECDCMITTPLLDWDGYVDPYAPGDGIAGLDLNRMTVLLDGQEWKVADKGLPARYGPVPVALSLGLRRN
jgi:hypothetical protein